MAMHLALLLLMMTSVTRGHKGEEHGPRKFDHGVSLPTTRPLNIAHRGSCGVYPEHTVAAYQQAVDDGADVIECDVFITKDLQLICVHGAHLSAQTDIANRPEFAERKNTYTVHEKGTFEDWFTIDFTLAEIKTLRVQQNFDFRDQGYNGKFEISTLDEYIEVAKSAGRPVGIYPEIKYPNLANSMPEMIGKRFEDLLLDAVERHGYTQSTDPCFIQSFHEESLVYLRNKTDLPLVILVWLDEHFLGPDLNASRIEEWGQMFYGFGAWKPQVTVYYDDQSGYKNWISGETTLLDEVKKAGLKFHLYTFRNEDRYLAWDFHQDPIEEYDYFMRFNFDGYFTDFPKTFKRYLDSVYREEPVKEQCTSGATQETSMVLMIITLFVCSSISI